MKRILAMAAIALFMVSCSDDDSSSNNNQDTVLVKKTIENFDGQTVTNLFTYSGTKLVKISGDDGSETTFTYTGSLLMSSSYHDSEMSQQDTYTYNSDNTLKTHLMLVNDGAEYGERSEYTYNQNNTITVTEYYGDFDSQTTLDGTSTIVMNNGNIVSADGSAYTFDDKNNPLKNITAYNVFILAGAEGGVNNILTGATYGDSVFTYTYNSNNYPTSATETYDQDGDTGFITTQYFYE